MFLWPQQLQAAERFYLQQAHRQHHWDVHYNWGLRRFDWDPGALANRRFVVKSLEARLRDGTPVCLPEDGVLDALDLASAFDKDDLVTVYLALPVLQVGQANVMDRNPSADAASTGTQTLDRRYRLETQELEDENTGSDAQPIPVRFLNVKLLTSSQDLSGYEILPLARIQRPAKADAVPQLDDTFIPPVLACDAWKPLHADLLQTIYDRLGHKMDLLGRQVSSRSISFDTNNPGDNLLLGQLHALNRIYGVLHSIIFAEGIHPLEAYVELCRSAGQLAIFSDTRRAPTLPRYDHDDLGGCFYRVKQYIDSIEITEPSYEERPFIGKGLRIEVMLEPKWLEPVWDIFVGVKSELTAEETVRLLARRGPLDMKIGSTARVDEIYDRGAQGLEFTPTPRPPRALPTAPGLVYFQVNRDSQQAEWADVQKTLALALRLNQFRVVGNIDGQRQIPVRAGGDTKTLEFTLFLVPHE
jgi:type VI secretion system protein ImpJ